MVESFRGLLSYRSSKRKMIWDASPLDLVGPRKRVQYWYDRSIIDQLGDIGVSQGILILQRTHIFITIM